MPLCYLFSDPGRVYMLFRKLYVRYFYHLHNVTNQKGSITYLAILFENLLKQKDAHLFHHLVRINVPPLSIVFKWMVHAFVGVLDVEQILWLWDRMIGFDSTDIIAILAAAMVHIRKDMLMAAKDLEQVQSCFGDMRMMKVIPLIQNFIFG